MKRVFKITVFNEAPKRETLDLTESEFEDLLNSLIADFKEEFGEDYYIIKLAVKMGWDTRKMKSYIDNLTKFSPAAAFSVLLREIAIDFDNNHEGNIEDSKEIWVISMANGDVVKMDKSKIKNYRNFAAFRTKEEAMKAKLILNERLKNMFKYCGK